MTTLKTETEHRGFTIFLRDDLRFGVRHPAPEQHEHVKNLVRGSVQDVKNFVDEVIAEQEKAKRLSARFSRQVLTSAGDEVEIRGIHGTTGDPLTTPANVAGPFYGNAAWVAGLLRERAELKKRVDLLTRTLEPAAVKHSFGRYGNKGARGMEELAAAIDAATKAAVDGAPKPATVS